ncbi:hypothetical protein AB0T83_12885 [Fluviibacterium sp. DFM31]|uniref:Mitochondrial inner membrane protein n=1 Tax=Meridianimarinicoccus marinus TaxID=3231483 RepID=A0ABV3L9G2_9RHOB
MSSKDKKNDPEQTPEIEDKLDGAQESEIGQDSDDVEGAKPAEETGESVEDAEFTDLTEDSDDTADTAEDQERADDDPDDVESKAEDTTGEDSIAPEELAGDPAADADALAEAAVTETADDLSEAEAEASAAEDTAPVEDPTPEPSPVAAAAPAPAAEKSGGGFLPAVLGGLVAAGLGFGGATYLGTQDDGTAQSLATQSERMGALEARIGEIADAVSKPADTGAEDQIAALSQQLQGQLGDVATTLQGQFGDMASRLEAVVGTVGNVESSLSGAISGVQSGLNDLDGRLAAINERLTAVEKRPLQESSETAKAAFEAYERELDGLKKTLEEAQALNEQVNAEMAAVTDQARALQEEAKSQAAEVAATAQAQAAEVAAAAQAQAAEAAAAAEAKANAAAMREALASLDGAIHRGAPYVTPLAILSDLTEVPEVLSAHAEDGVQSLAQLRSAFPQQARAALDASIRETVADHTTGRVVAFLRSQTGARSLTPKEGNDPDAVLSRAEAALVAGDLDTTLAELALLPPAGQAELADWITAAQARRDVASAASDLAATLLAN